MRPQDRYDWIERNMRDDPMQARLVSRDVLDRDFVDDYIEATNAPYAAQPYGAPRCPQLGRDLAQMVKAGTLKRTATGIEGMAGMGFPRWVWSYRLAHS